MSTNHLFHGKREVPKMTTNNEAYYTGLVKGLKEAKQHDVNDIEVFTNSELICNQMKGIYQVRKENLKPLHKEAINWSCPFQHFTINHSADIEKMSTDIMSREFLSTYVDAKYDIGLPSTATLSILETILQKTHLAITTFYIYEMLIIGPKYIYEF